MPQEKHRILRERAEETALAIIKKLEPYCSKIQVAGSIRRGVPWVHDIDIVLILKDWWNLYNEILSLTRPFKPKPDGEKIKSFSIGDITVDLYITSETDWATTFLIRTGSAANNIRLCSRAMSLGWHLHADGSGLFNQDGKRIAGDNEISIYEALKLPYQEPAQRR